MSKNKIFLFSFIASIIILNIILLKRIAFYDEEHTLIEDYYIADVSLNDEELKTIDIENEYLGIINIPSIDLEEGFYHQLSSKNKLKYGVKNVKDDMDNVLVLASHSGHSDVAKFNNLKRLHEGEEIILDYNKQTYHYLFSHSYKVEKTGHIYVKYDHTKKALILITCDLSNNDKQIVYVSYML